MRSEEGQVIGLRYGGRAEDTQTNMGRVKEKPCHAATQIKEWLESFPF